MSLSVVLQQASPGKIASGPREDKRDPIVIVQVGVSQLGEQQDAGMVEQAPVAAGVRSGLQFLDQLGELSGEKSLTQNEILCRRAVGVPEMGRIMVSL